MNKKAAIAAVVAVVVSAGSAMARGPELHPRIGAFQKGGTGVEIRSDHSEPKQEPSYSLSGKPSADSVEDQRVAQANQPEQRTPTQATQEGRKGRFKTNDTHHQW